MPMNFDQINQEPAQKESKAQPAFPMSEHKTLESGGLVKRSTVAAPLIKTDFDVQGHLELKADLERSTKARADQLNSFAVKYAQDRMAQVLSDIDLAAAAIRDNALNSMGIGGSAINQDQS